MNGQSENQIEGAMRRFLKFTAVLVALFSTSLALADSLFPVSSLRRQVGNDCWAYGAAHMTEARLQYRTRANAAIDIQKSYYYWQIQDRLYNSYLRKKPSVDLLSYLGYAADFWYIMAQHGMETFATNSAPIAPDFNYPSAVQYILSAPDWRNDLRSTFAITSLERELVSSSMSDQDARALIKSTVDEKFRFEAPLANQTPWIDGREIDSSDLFQAMVGADLPKGQGYRPYDFVFITKSAIVKHPELNGKWIKYDDDRFPGVGNDDVSFLLKVARVSLDRGWPVTLETKDHVLTCLGYKTIQNPNGTTKFVYAIANSSGSYFRSGLSWQTESDLLDVVVDSTVFYPVVSDLLPPISVKKLGNFRDANEFSSVFVPPKGD